MTRLYVFFISMIILSILLYIGLWKYFGYKEDTVTTDTEIEYTAPNCGEGDFALILKHKNQTVNYYLCGDNLDGSPDWIITETKGSWNDKEE